MEGARKRTLKGKHFFLFHCFLYIFLLSLFLHLKRNAPKNMMVPLTKRSEKGAPPYPYDYKFIINQPGKCKNKTPFLVMLVHSETKEVAARNAIRRSWGNESICSKVTVVRLFLTGISPRSNSTVQDMLQYESDVYRDIIQQDFLDSYFNLTLKTLMGMEWVTKHCPDAKYALKIDSDTFLNVGFLVYHLLSLPHSAQKDYVSGYYIPKGPLNRFERAKNYVPKEIFSQDVYPPYLAGPGYVFSSDMAMKIYTMAQITPLIPVEDAFVGICLKQLNIKITEPPPNLFKVYNVEYDMCMFHTLIIAHPYSPEELLQIWKHFNSDSLKCKSIQRGCL